MVLILDDFLKEPHKVRDQALKSKYEYGQDQLPGYRSINRFQQAEVSRLMVQLGIDRSLIWGCAFQYFLAKKGKGYVHIDPLLRFSGLIYLSENSPAGSGTSFFRHKKHKIERVDFKSQWLKEKEAKTILTDLEKSKYRKQDWIETMHIPEKFNRLVLFDPNYYHMNSKKWGSSVLDGRLTCNFAVRLKPLKRGAN